MGALVSGLGGQEHEEGVVLETCILERPLSHVMPSAVLSTRTSLFTSACQVCASKELEISHGS